MCFEPGSNPQPPLAAPTAARSRSASVAGIWSAASMWAYARSMKSTASR